MTKEEAIKWLENLNNDIGKLQFQSLWGYGEAIAEIIDLLSAETEWIPCSERLPDEGEKVLASTKNTVFTQVFKGTQGTSDSWWWNNNTIKTIYAWMPLPKPYKGGDTE